MTPHDALAKDLLEALLGDLGVFEREHEVSAPPAQRGDVFFAPSPGALATLEELGVLGRMVKRASLLEHFGEAPSTHQSTEVARKLLNQRQRGRGAVAERAWMLCAGRPDAAIREMRMVADPLWPTGFYTLSEALPVSMVVLPELPETPDTLALRLMARREVQQRAMRTLRARLDTVPHGQRLFKTVVHWLRSLHGRVPRVHEEELMLDLSETEAFLKKQYADGVQQGMQQGMQQGQLSLLVCLCEQRLGRTLSNAEQTALGERVSAQGAERVVAELLQATTDELAAELRGDRPPLT